MGHSSVTDCDELSANSSKKGKRVETGAETEVETGAETGEETVAETGTEQEPGAETGAEQEPGVETGTKPIMEPGAEH